MASDYDNSASNQVGACKIRGSSQESSNIGHMHVVLFFLRIDFSTGFFKQGLNEATNLGTCGLQGGVL